MPVNSYNVIASEVSPPTEKWKIKMGKAAFRVAFPRDKMGDQDFCTIAMKWYPATEGYHYSEVTFEPGSDANCTLIVTWWRKAVWGKNLRPGHVGYTRTFEGDEVATFWLDLMREG